MQPLKTYATFGLNIGDSVWPIPHRNINVTDGLTFLIFFGRLVWPSTDLGQSFSGIFIFMLHATFTLYAIIVFIAWFKLLYWLLIYYSYLYYC